MKNHLQRGWKLINSLFSLLLWKQENVFNQTNDSICVKSKQGILAEVKHGSTHGQKIKNP